MRALLRQCFILPLSLVGRGDNTPTVQQSWELILEWIMYFQQCVNYGKADFDARCTLLAAQ